jgi:hypothetical protein
VYVCALSVEALAWKAALRVNAQRGRRAPLPTRALTSVAPARTASRLLRSRGRTSKVWLSGAFQVTVWSPRAALGLRTVDAVVVFGIGGLEELDDEAAA